MAAATPVAAGVESTAYKEPTSMNASTNVSHAKLDPEHVAIIEQVKGSDIPVQLMYV